MRTTFSDYLFTVDPLGFALNPLRDEERDLCDEALFDLEYEVGAWHPEVTSAVQCLHHALTRLDPFRPRVIDGSAGFALFMREALSELRRAAEAGALRVERADKPRVVAAVEPAEAPGPAPVAFAAAGETTSDFIVQFVDEVGDPIDGLEVMLAFGGKSNKLTTDGNGVARFSGQGSSFASAVPASVEALRQKLEPRWEQGRLPLPPSGPHVRQVVFGQSFESVGLENGVQETIVVKPVLGRIFVELRDKVARKPWAQCPYSIENASGSVSFSGQSDDLGRLEHREVPPGDYRLKLEVVFVVAGEEVRETLTTAVVVQPDGRSAPQLRLLGARPRVGLARAAGLIFETNKSFVLPAALRTIDRLRELYYRDEQATLLGVGHTDTTGEPSVNDPLSLARAKSVIAFLRDDVDAWLRFYESGTPASQRWGAREDLQMIGALPDAGRRPEDADPVRWFQKTRALAVDGVAGPKTRRQLVTEYMALDEACLIREDVALATQSHGCGENFPLGDTGEDVDPSASDGAQDPLDRRAELFFFDPEFGVQPPPPGDNSPSGSTGYPRWRDAATLELDALLGGKRQLVLIDELGAPLSFEPYALLTEDGGRVEGSADADGVVVFPPGIGKEVTLRLLALTSEVELATT